MNLKHKILFGAIFLATIPVIITSFVISQHATSSSEISQHESARSRLVAVRDITKSRIEDYFTLIRKQVDTLSKNRMVVEAAKDFQLSFGNYKSEITFNRSNALSQLSQYYTQQFGAEYQQRNSLDKSPENSWLNQLDDDSIALQFKLIANSNFPLGEKDKLADMQDASEYAIHHSRYHPVFRDYLQQFGYYDIFIADINTGDIIYSVFKELDYSTSLINGPFAQSGIGQAFNQAKNTRATYITDFSPYSPSYEDPAAFIATPISDAGRIIGILIFQMPIDRINQIMTYNGNWQTMGLGNSGESYIVGPDKKARTLSRFLIEDKNDYLKTLSQSGLSDAVLKVITTKNTNIGLQPVETPGVGKALAGSEGFEIFNDYRDIPVLSAYAPLNIEGLNWVILSEVDKEEAFLPSQKLSNDILYASIIVSIIVATFGVIFGIFFAKRITRPILDLSTLLQNIQKTSDLTIRSKNHDTDEIGEASQSLNKMLEQFHDGMQHVAKSSTQIAQTTETTLSISAETQKNIDEQRTSTEMVATAINQMTATVQEVTQNISKTSDSANRAFQETSSGDKVVKQTIQEILSFADNIQAAADAIEQLEQESENIGSVVDVIKSIADQTNLLALNAAIEAARAGEQGRGFAVVADEVRTLAGRTQESTEEINKMVERLQNGASGSVSLMKGNLSQIQQVVEQAQKAGKALTNISSAVNEINEMSTQIAVASEQQVRVTQDVSENIIQINSIAAKTVDDSRKTAKSSQSLAELAATLENLVHQFKL
ncbi:methyl-accepting chemotaxis protein [Aliikangiella maris]|uniref:Methyl-accepting chemotaxis protein n=2 Tax=Aliikangiella maris TaxID=3162458 RepID=A0ABV2C006_9GAMM